MHRDLWGYGKCAGDKQKPRQKNVQHCEKGRPPLNEDSAIIMALVLLLMSDNPDEILISALLYILS